MIKSGDIKEPTYQRELRKYEEELHRTIVGLPIKKIERILSYAKGLKMIKMTKSYPIKESYIHYLIDDGVRGEKLKKAIKAIEEIDARAESQSRKETWEKMVASADKRMEKWCQERGISMNSLSEDEMMQIISEGIENVRKNKDER